MIRSIDMHNNASVLLRAPILSGKGWTFEAADTCRTMGQADVIDLNGNGVDTTQRGGFMVGSFSYNDPALTVSLRQLREIARAKGTEVLTGSDLPASKIQAEQRGVSENFFTQETHTNQRSLDQLARHEVPSCAYTAWAIDTVTGEFLVYDKSAAGAPASPLPTPEPTPSPLIPAPTPPSAALPKAQPVPPSVVATPQQPSPSSRGSRQGVGLLTGCGLAMGSIVVASHIPGPAGLAVLVGGMLAGGLVATTVS